MGFLPLEPVATYDETRDEDGQLAFTGKAKAFRGGDRKDTRSRHVARADGLRSLGWTLVERKQLLDACGRQGKSLNFIIP
jgi:hypothetical protein